MHWFVRGSPIHCVALQGQSCFCPWVKLIFSKADLFPILRLIGNSEIDEAPSLFSYEVFGSCMGLIASNDSALLFKWFSYARQMKDWSHGAEPDGSAAVKSLEPAQVGTHQIRGWKAWADHPFFVPKAISSPDYFRPVETALIFRSKLVDGFSAPLLMCWFARLAIGVTLLIVSCVSNDLLQWRKSTRHCDWFSFLPIKK